MGDDNGGTKGREEGLGGKEGRSAKEKRQPTTPPDETVRPRVSPEEGKTKDRSESESVGLVVGSGPLTVSDGYNEYNTYTKQISDVVRQLSLAGIAITWALRVTVKCPLTDVMMFPPILYWPMFLFVSVLLADMLQYVLGGKALYRVLSALSEHDGITRDTAYDFDASILDWSRYAYRLKIFLIAIAYPVLIYVVIETDFFTRLSHLPSCP